MIINKSIDIEAEVRMALDDYLTVYCRPLPENYTLPHILVTWVGGSIDQTIDTFEVVLDDGTNKRTVTLNRPFWGLHVPPGIWASEQGFSSGSICLVLASHGYSEEDYIRNYDDYLKYIEEQKKKMIW